jgi:hypothetical protein
MSHPPDQPPDPQRSQAVAPYPQAAEGRPRYGPAARQQAGPPPGYYFPAPPKPLGSLGLAAAWLAVVVTVVGLTGAALAWPAQSRYLEAAERGESFFETWTAFDIVGIVQLPVTIAAYVVTCLWLYRARTNATVMRPYLHHARSPGWAWGGWVCPVVNLWFPYQVVRDVARDPQAPRPVPGIGTWWTFWLLSSVIGEMGARFVGIDTSLVPVFGALVSAGAVLQVVALVLWLRIVRAITQQQDRRMGVAPQPSTA